MSRNESLLDVLLKYQNELYHGLTKAKLEVENAIRYVDMYGEWGVQMTYYVTPYLCILPVIATTLLLYVFKKRRLYGPTQKCLIFIIILDMSFTLFTGLRDGVLNALNLNYGFIEYKICWLIVISIRMQFIVHAASIWIKSGMLFHQVILCQFPFKVRQWNLKPIFIFFIVFNIVIAILYGLEVSLSPLTSKTMIQEFVLGLPMKKIDACVIKADYEYFNIQLIFILNWFKVCVQMIYFTTLPILLHLICTLFLVYLLRKDNKRLSVLTNFTKKRNVNYLVLMKVNILLGISFMLQEIPIISSFLYGLINNIRVPTKAKGVADAQSTIFVYMYLTFSIGKPLDLILYASLSRVVKSELLNLMRCKKSTQK